MATASEIAELAFRRLGIKAEDESLTTDQDTYGTTVLASLFAELENEYDISWTTATVPDVSTVPLANYLAVELAPSYGLPPLETRAQAWRRLMATIRADNREDFRDFDDSGTIDQDEEDAGNRARYY